MGLPTKGSRSITVGNVSYRWVVSARPNFLRLIVERHTDPGQRLVAWLHYHDSYVRDPAGRWCRVAQLRSVAPGVVRVAIELALARGWQPGKKGVGVFDLGDMDERFPVTPPADAQSVRLKEVVRDIVGDLRFDISVDVEWRRRLFHATPGERHEIPWPNEHGLRFAAFFDGWTGDGMWVIGIECADFPAVCMYTVNGGAFL
jgi:hypothetical protein